MSTKGLKNNAYPYLFYFCFAIIASDVSRLACGAVAVTDRIGPAIAGFRPAT